MDDYEFSTRLKFFLSKKDISREKFYRDYLQNEVEKRTYDSYFSKGVNKRYPKKETVELIAQKLGIEPWLLTPHTKEYEDKLKRLVRMIGITEEEFEENDFKLCDAEQLEYIALEIEHLIFNEILFGKSDSINNKIRNIILLTVQYYFDIDEPFISDKILEIIQYVDYMNEDTKKRFYEYVNLLIAGLYLDGCDEVYSYPDKYNELCERYFLSLDELDKRHRIHIGNVNIKDLEKRVAEKGTSNNSFNELKETLIYISLSNVKYVNILLKCLLVGDDLLESIAIIVKPLYGKDFIKAKLHLNDSEIVMDS